MSVAIPTTSGPALLDRYDTILLDSYGVLVDGSGALPGAAEFLAQLDQRGHRWMVVSNDASRLPERSVARYRERGLPITVERLLTSGDLIAPYFEAHRLAGARSVVLGPADSCVLVANAGGIVVDASEPNPDVVVVCDDDGYPFRETIETLIASLYASMEAGHDVRLVLPNPDLIYPRGGGRFGLTAGSVAGLIEGALALRASAAPPRFVGLGKPHAPIFEMALTRLGVAASDDVLMIGDQLATDIAGAHTVGLSSALIGTGVCAPQSLPEQPRPTWWLPGLSSAL